MEKEQFEKTGQLLSKHPKDPKDELWELRVKEKKDQASVEQQRYKQDCRKRALDLAHTEYPDVISGKINSNLDVLGNADKYYQWLISIPETK